MSLHSWIVALSTWKDICDQSRVDKYSFIQDALLDYDIEPYTEEYMKSVRSVKGVY